MLKDHRPFAMAFSATALSRYKLAIVPARCSRKECNHSLSHQLRSAKINTQEREMRRRQRRSYSLNCRVTVSFRAGARLGPCY